MKARAITLAVTLAACAHSAPQHNDGPQVVHASATPKPLVAEAAGPSCPLALPGTTLSFAPISGGGSILFANGDDGALHDLRSRVHLLATEHNRARYRLAMVDLPHRAAMVPIPGGARLDLVTGVGNDTLELQRSIETHGSSILELQCNAGK
jgi:hypothetical protein